MLDLYKEFKDFKAFEVTFSDSKGESKRLFCSVKSIENNNVIIDANHDKNKNTFANPGDELKLYIYTENGIYSASSKVISMEKGITSTEYIISYPTNSKHSQRREYFRADLGVEFKMKVSPKVDSVEIQEIEGKTRNICGKGMSYISNKPFPEHEKIEIDLIFEEKTINTLASFVYSKQIVEGAHPKFVNAFAFTTIIEKDIDLIVKKCFLHQLELRKKQ